MSDKERCLNVSIQRPNAVRFSNQFYGTSKEFRGEGMVGVGVSCISDLDVSPFSNLVADLFSFLLGAMEMVWILEKERVIKMCEGKIETEEESDLLT